MPNLPLHSSSSESSPTLTELERYAQGRMSEAERMSFEETWGDDPFLMDAVEGLEHMPDRQQLRKRLRYLRRQSEERVLLRSRQVEARNKRGSRVRPLWWPQAALGIAAAVALLLLVGVLMPWRNGEDRAAEVAPAEATAETEPLPPVAPTKEPSLLASANEAKEASRVSPEPQAKSAQAKGQVALAPIVVDSMQTAETRPSASRLANVEGTAAELDKVNASPVPATISEEAKPQVEPEFEDDALAAEPAIKSERTVAMPQARPLRAREAPAGSYSAAPARSSAQQKTIPGMAEARRSYAQQQWAISRDYSAAVLQEKPGHPEAQYYLGSSAYWQGDYERAIATLAQVPAGASPWYGRAQWTLAQAYLADQQPEQARAILTTMAASEGSYRAAAQHLLDQMD